MLAKNGVGHLAVRDNLYRTVVVLELLLGDDVRVVAVDCTVDTNDTLHHAGYRADVVRYHHYRHSLVEFAQQGVELVLETVVHEVCRLIQYQ